MGGHFSVYNNIARLNGTADGFHNQHEAGVQEIRGVPQGLVTTAITQDDFINIGNGFQSVADGKVYNFDFSYWNNCSEVMVDLGIGSHSYLGGNFCCPEGHYCPNMMLDIECPENWGYKCTKDEVRICRPGFYCVLPGVEIICPHHHICAEGASVPRKCHFWELCGEEGMMETGAGSGLMFSFLMVGGTIIVVVIILSVKNRDERILKEKVSE